jgi:hypothetical protein
VKVGNIRPLRPLPYLVWGVGLCALKVGIDTAVAAAFGEPFSVTYYVSPLDAPLLRPGGRVAYWWTMWAVALPFLGLGFWLTVRRLLDAGVPAWLAILYFVPFANLIFIAVCVVLPPREAADEVEPSRAEASAPERRRRSRGTDVVVAGAAGAATALGAFALAVGVFEAYGAGLFLGAPAMLGFVGTLVLARLRPLDRQGVVLVTLVGMTLVCLAMLLFAIEGAICLLMAAPLAGISAALGAAVGCVASLALPRPSAMAGILLAPMFIAIEVLSPLPEVEDQPVTTEVIVHAPPEVVWEHVLAFPDLGPADHWVFKAGVGMPIGAVIEGEGVGAVRRCRFTTGEFIEPITAWDPPRHLGFDVEATPAPMRELSPWDIHPRHLDGYFRTTRGRFLLEPLDGGRTRLTGTTWYRLDLAPRPYWMAWADMLIHRIHERVLGHVKRLSEGS